MGTMRWNRLDGTNRLRCRFNLHDLKSILLSMLVRVVNPFSAISKGLWQNCKYYLRTVLPVFGWSHFRFKVYICQQRSIAHDQCFLYIDYPLRPKISLDGLTCPWIFPSH